MKHLIGVLALACAVCGAPLAAQPPAKTGQGAAKSGGTELARPRARHLPPTRCSSVPQRSTEWPRSNMAASRGKTRCTTK